MDAPRQFSAGSWTSRGSAIALLVCAGMMTGCQILTVADVELPAEVPVVVHPTELERLLAEGTWEADRNWSPLATTQETAENVAWRWKFRIAIPPAKPGSPVSDLADLKTRYAWVCDEPAGERTAAMRRELETVCHRPGAAGWTAAILLSRFQTVPDDTAILHEKLTSSIDSNTDHERPPGNMFAAAVETWCRQLAQLVGEAEVNLAPAGKLLEAGALTDDARGELFRGIARRIAPRNIPGLGEVMVRFETTALATPQHQAAVEACVIHAWSCLGETPGRQFAEELWPDGLWHCRFAKDSTLRKLFGRWAALAHHPDALAVLKSQRLDIDLDVREAAVTSLGLLDPDDTRLELLAVMEKGTDPERAAAVVCLAHGSGDEFQRYARDESPRVRKAVAKVLGREPTRAAAMILAELVRDQNSEVQLAALDACVREEWKAHGRVSLLLHALRVGSLPAQMAALAQLRTEWGREPLFPLNGTYEERDAAVRQLALEHNVSAEVVTAFTKPVDSSPTSVAALARQEEVRRRIREFLHGPTTDNREPIPADELKSLDRSAVAILEQELGLSAGPRVEHVYREVLPKLDPAYAALRALEAADPAARRRAAQELHRTAEQVSLSPCVLRRLLPRIAAEQDRAVWQEIMAAIVPDALPDAAQIALVALNSPWPDIRQFGCDYFERHPQPEYALWVLPRLQDSDRPLRSRAVRILAECGHPVALDGQVGDAEHAGLRQLLTEADLQLRAEVVLAMTRLGDAQAAQELVRQSYDPHPRQREQAVAAMGQSGQTRFVEHLLRQSWTETDRGVQAALLKALEQLVPDADHPGLAPNSSISDKITGWAQWREARQPQASRTAVSRDGIGRPVR